jgi:GR25 family glycosyltransferase involved in LPS biosynthesis
MVLTPRFTLADQLIVDPNPLLQVNDKTRACVIEMTKQEVAVALSHIEVWKLIAEADVPSALVLEDDVFMTRGFARDFGTTWMSLPRSETGVPDFDLLYLAFMETGSVSPSDERTGNRRLRRPGIWEASGYILSREGARKLLDGLPVYGPVDLWLNMQFGRLRAFAAARPLIEQRIDEPSTNSYSVMPVLSQVGVITRERPLLPTTSHLAGPVVVIGDPDTGLSSLATALSMLGYTCISDLERLPDSEENALLRGRRGRRFNAYVNIGSQTADVIPQIAKANPSARFILTSENQALPLDLRDRILRLTPLAKDKWALLSDFLDVDYPAFPYPTDDELGIRRVSRRPRMQHSRVSTDLRSDTGPWILQANREWSGVAVDAGRLELTSSTHVDFSSGDVLEDTDWKLRNDTFPSNLALFTPANVFEGAGQADLTIREERSAVRALTSGAIASQARYHYGSFSAVLKPPSVPGLVTGMFLHRNSPRQEIDIEFLGKDTRKMLVNVFYNPGPEGTRLEYGYRGTPTLVDLGFDAADDFHAYRIDWQPNSICWLVDGEVVYERLIWDPTPIPDQPLEFNLNLWHSRSKGLAGPLSSADLPASAGVRSIAVRAKA